MRRIWFWQRIVSPHVFDLAVELASAGCEVHYATERLMSAERTAQGWQPPSADSVLIHQFNTLSEAKALIASSTAESVHICQGIRGNGMIRNVQLILQLHGRKHWIMMEAIKETYWLHRAKRLVYSRLFRRMLPSIQGVLATGHQTPAWLGARGLPSDLIYPFAYFLPRPTSHLDPRTNVARQGVNVLFVGRLVKLKRVDWLIKALASVAATDLRLTIVGSGPEEAPLRALAARLLPGQVSWEGRLRQREVARYMAASDLLVLPSKHDGWGAVISEALLMGCPVVASEGCGAAGVVRASGFGGVFRTDSLASLTTTLATLIAAGGLDMDSRRNLSKWAACLTGKAGAKYLLSILDHQSGFIDKPAIPWIESNL